jgi:hypothetical protein
MRRALFGAVIAAVLGSGCTAFSARESKYKFKIVAPERVKAGEMLTFTVELTTLAGEQATGATYGWLIDWPDVKGIMHVGRAFEPQQKEAKCSVGTATLRVYAKNAQNYPVQMARQDIQVE